MRSSRQRDAVLNVLKSYCDHPTADVIYSRVKEIIPNFRMRVLLPLWKAAIKRFTMREI